MKFNKTLEAEATALPADWRPYLINYKGLKKKINLIVKELADMGLDRNHTMSCGPPPPPQQTTKDVPTRMPENCPTPLAQIQSVGTETTTASVQVPIGSPSEVSPVSESPDLLVYRLNQKTDGIHSTLVVPWFTTSPILASPGPVTTVTETPACSQGTVVTLKSDTTFFGTILHQLDKMYDFQRQGENDFYQRVERLVSQLGAVSSPYGDDMYLWRDIFRWYQAAEIWTHTQGDYKVSGSVERSKRRFLLFVQRLVQRAVQQQFRTPRSTATLAEFLNLNVELLSVKFFRDLNQTALVKILKKHDKRTHLRATLAFHKIMDHQTHMQFTSNLPNALYSALLHQLLSIVLQPDDYSCPLCLCISWRPVRLACRHVFCLRCLVKATDQQMVDCPLCRRPGAILEATSRNLDTALENFLKLYFPREIRRRKVQLDKEYAKMEIRAILGSHVQPSFAHDEDDADDEEMNEMQEFMEVFHTSEGSSFTGPSGIKPSSSKSDNPGTTKAPK
ncbi:hypothetical protein IWQ61_001870 [Dispira simplex]|nr:hypothetical protein IWQ61_001870 [Dispira simplex]